MRITGLRTLHADGGWRTISYLRLETDTGLVGWSEYFESAWSPGLTGVIESLAPHVLGPRSAGVRAAVERPAGDRRAMSAGGLAAQAIAAVENACIDLAGKAAGLPGLRALRRPGARSHPHVLVALRVVPGDARRSVRDPAARRRSRAGWRSAAEVRERGYTAAKTNPVLYGPGGPSWPTPASRPASSTRACRATRSSPRRARSWRRCARARVPAWTSCST